MGRSGPFLGSQGLRLRVSSFPESPAREELQAARSGQQVLCNGHDGRADQHRSKGFMKNLSGPAVPEGAIPPLIGGKPRELPGSGFQEGSQGNLQLPGGKSEKAPQKDMGSVRYTLSEERTMFAWLYPSSDRFRRRALRVAEAQQEDGFTTTPRLLQPCSTHTHTHN